LLCPVISNFTKSGSIGNIVGGGRFRPPKIGDR